MRTLDGKPFSILSYSIGPGHKSADDGSRLDLTDVDMGKDLRITLVY